MKITKTQKKKITRDRRKGRVRAKINGTATKPRLAVFRSNKFVYAQLIDDENGATLAAADSRTASGKGAIEKARAVGMSVAESAKKLKIDTAVFDRGGFIYIGQIKALADGAREGGLTI